jgi:UDP-N-acetyl-2-amino-2-deoxyglucuronate dehydrogenase
VVTTAAVIGCGDVSVVHLDAIGALPDTRLVGVCDTDPAAADPVAARRQVPSFSDHHQLLEELRPDVVHICTPHDQHAAVAVDCLAAGVDVILEKPLAHSLEDAHRIIAAAEEHPGSRIAVCFQNRYNAAVQAARALLESGDLGAVTGSSATVLWHRTPAYYQAKPWRGRRDRSGGGVLINQAIHTLDLVQWLVGDVTEVAGRAGTYSLAGVVDVEDTAQLVLDHHSGARSVFFATVANAVDAPVTLDVTTEHATLHLRGDLTVAWADGRTEVVAERTAASAGRAYWGVSHQLLIADFYARRGDDAPFWISPREALKSLEILHAVYRLSDQEAPVPARS